MAKMKICRQCGREIANNAKVCPHCGGKNPKPIYKRVWFVILIIALALWLVNAVLSDPSYVPEDEREYTAVTVDQLYEELNDNPLKAKDTYTDAYVAVEGQMRVIDSDGESVSIYPLGYDSLDGIHCILSSDEQREKVKEHTKGDIVTVKGKITEVDGTWTYKIYVDSIE